MLGKYRFESWHWLIIGLVYVVAMVVISIIALVKGITTATAPAKTETVVSAKDEEIVIYDSSMEKDEEKEIAFYEYSFRSPKKLKADKVEILPSSDLLVTSNGKKTLLSLRRDITMRISFGKDVEVSIVPSFPVRLPEKPEG